MLGCSDNLFKLVSLFEPEATSILQSYSHFTDRGILCPVKFVSVVPVNNQTHLLTPGFKAGFIGGLVSFELILLSFFFSPLRALHSPVGGVKM